MPRRTSIMLFLNIKKKGQKTFVKDFKVMPIYMKVGNPRYGFEGSDKYLGKGMSRIRTLIPVYLKKYTGVSASSLSALNYDLPLKKIPSKSLRQTVRNGSYRLEHNMKLARDIVLKYFPEDKFLTERELENPYEIFK